MVWLLMVKGGKGEGLVANGLGGGAREGFLLLVQGVKGMFARFGFKSREGTD